MNKNQQHATAAAAAACILMKWSSTIHSKHIIVDGSEIT